MREGWMYKKLGEVCSSIKDGSHNPPKGCSFSEYIMISSQNIFNEELRLEDVRYLGYDDFIIEDKRTNLRAGDVLLTIVGTIGRCYVFKGNEGNITLQRSVAVLSPKDFIDSRFLMYSLRGKNQVLVDEAHGIAQKGIYLKQLSSLEISYPNVSTQQQIVSELDLLSHILDQKRQQLKEYDALAESIFYDMFGDPNNNDKNWATKSFFSCCKNCDSQRKPITSKDRVAGNIPYYGASGIVDYVKDYIFDGDYLLISEDGANLLMRSTPIAFQIRGKNWVNNHAHVVKFEHIEEQIFMEYFFNLLDLKDLITGCAQPKLTQGALNKIPVFEIPFALQRSFAAKIESIEHQKQLLRASIKETEMLFQSRMDYWFNG